MKDLIRKILKENQEDFGWVEADDDSVEAGRSIVYDKWRNIEREYGPELTDIFDSIVSGGIRDVNKLGEIADLLYDQFSSTYESGRDYGFDSGMDNCTCDNCCDDYVWYETYDEDVSQAKQDGYDDGYDTATDEFRSKIEELEDKIEELESQLNENVNKKNIKGI